jgi:hypothetical protein
MEAVVEFKLLLQTADLIGVGLVLTLVIPR